MSMDVTDLVMTKYFIDEKSKEVQRLNKEIDELQDKLVRNCTHPTAIKTEKYNSGGYDYVSSVVITHTCTICGKVLKSYEDPNHKGYHA